VPGFDNMANWSLDWKRLDLFKRVVVKNGIGSESVFGVNCIELDNFKAAEDYSVEVCVTPESRVSLDGLLVDYFLYKGCKAVTWK
jgi:hypothetical protein